ncbi:ogr/Delta-like zinc finger family protein [Aeromonas veronii]|uniref:ogr/Delta-like zinc finger family protein n=1 Tax=Aeromonas veronii TaxID=654 RepID=UPI003BA2FD06
MTRQAFDLDRKGGRKAVYCKVCGQRGRITKTNRLSDDVSDLYCQCTDAECGHSWVATLSCVHTLSPSAKTTNQLVLKGLGAQ